MSVTSKKLFWQNKSVCVKELFSKKIIQPIGKSIYSSAKDQIILKFQGKFDLDLISQGHQI